MTLRLPRLAPLLIFLATPVLAQNGDKAGEVQHPPDASLTIPPAPILAAEEELATFKLAPGFHAELVAGDPLVGDPVAMALGPDGRLWVLEMRAFMPNADGTGEKEPVGCLAVLEDTKGTGHFDKRTVFIDHLVLPRAFALVGDGVLVAAPTHLWFCRDTNGDGVADEKTEIASDYGNTTNPEHNANGLMRALDNWIYSANFTARFRYQGDGKFLRDLTITRGQWGISQDDFGRIYHNSNSDPLRFDAIPSAYLARNPNFAAAGANVQLVPANLRVFPGRVTPGINRGYKTLDAQGKMYAVTAACGPVVYRGTLFPAEFHGDAFICEPAGNLIKRIKLTEMNGLMHGANAYDGTEFMTSTDERFRPVNAFNGPDGALYVVDMYRGIIQHRIYMTSYLRKQVDDRGLAKGLGFGRIWRIVPDGTPAANFRLTLAHADAPALVAALKDANGWTRDMAQRLLVEQHAPAAVGALRALAIDGSAPPLARLQALWTLEGLNAIDRTTLLAAFNDADAHVCAAAIRLSEKFLAPPGDAEIFAKVAALQDRADPAVRLQLVLSLGEVRTPAGDAALTEVVRRTGGQAFIAHAAVSGLRGREEDFVAGVALDTEAGEQVASTVTYATSAVLKSGNAARIDRILQLATATTTAEWVRTDILAGVKYFLPKSAEGKSFTGTLPAEPKPLVALAEHPDMPAGKTATQLLKQLKWPGKAGMEASNAKPLTPEQQALFNKAEQFAVLCATCHPPNGQGLAGLAPSLLYSRWVLGDERVLARIVLNGKAQENLTMPPWKAALDDEAIAGVLTFIRRSWGHDANPIMPSVVAEARAAVAKRDEPWSEAALEDLLQELAPARRERN